MGDYSLPDWDDLNIESLHITHSEPTDIRRGSTSTPIEYKYKDDTIGRMTSSPRKDISPTTHNQTRTDRVTHTTEYRDIIMNKDMEISHCMNSIKSASEAIALMNDVVSTIENYINDEGGIDSKHVQKLLHPLRGIRNDNTSSHESVPREAVILSAQLKQLSHDIRSLLGTMTDCMMDRSRIYQDQLRRMREVSNLATRNAIQAEKAEFSSTVIQLKTLHVQDMEQAAAERARIHAEAEDRIQEVLKQLDEVQEENARLRGADERAADVEEQISAAIQRARREEAALQDERMKELREHYEQHLKDADRDAERRLKEAEESYKDKLDMQAKHHEKMYELIVSERERKEEECAQLRATISDLKDEISVEKDKHLQELADERQKQQVERDQLSAEHIQVVAAVKAELTAKIRQMKIEERNRIEDVEVRYAREKEQIEAAHAAESDRMVNQHRRALQQQRAQLEVRLEEELQSAKRRHDNETRRFTSEIDRLRRVVARKGMGDDGVEETDFGRSQLHRSTVQSQSNTWRDFSRTLRPSGYTKSFGAINEIRSPERRPESIAQEPNSAHRGSRSVMGEESFVGTTNDGDDKQTQSTDRDTVESLLLPKGSPGSPVGKSKSSLNWGALNESIAMQESDFVKESGRGQDHSVRQSDVRPSGTSSRTPSRSRVLDVRSSVDSLGAPPPPPPDAFDVDVAWETSKQRDHNVGSNAAKVGKYMKQLQKYLEGDIDTGMSDTFFSSTMDEEGGDLPEDLMRIAGEFTLRNDIGTDGSDENNFTDMLDEVDSLDGE